MPSNVVNPSDSGGRSLNSLFDPTNRLLAVPQGGPSSYDANSGTYYSGLVLATPTSSGGHVILDANTIATYACCYIGLTPAASCTDLAILNGAANKVIRIMRIVVSGFTTAATGATLDLQLIKRSTANTGAGVTNVVPVPFDSNDAAAGAVLTAYSANPSPLGTAVGLVYLTKFQQTLGTATATDFPTNVPFMAQWGITDSKPIVLRSAAEGLAINFNATSFAAGSSVDVMVEWTESLT